MTIRSKAFWAVLILILSTQSQLYAAGRPAAQKISPLSDSLRKVRRTPSSAQRDAFGRFAAKEGAGWKVRYSPRTAAPEALMGGRTGKYPGSPEQAAMSFLTENKDMLAIDPSELKLAQKKQFMGITHLQFQQYRGGLPVEFSYARVHVSASGEVSGYQGRFEPAGTLDTAPSVTLSAAVSAAIADLGANMKIFKTELVVFPDDTDGTQKLAWKIRGRGKGLWVYYIDAHTGAVLFRYDDLRYACATYGNSSGDVYTVSPLPDHNVDNLEIRESAWTNPVSVGLRDQYVWVADYSSRTVTNQSGDYCAQKAGKIFSSLKGPYFSVTNFRGPSAHYDNGGGQWRTYAYTRQTPHPYDINQTYSYDVAIPDNWTSSGYTFAKVMPRFSSFEAGDLDILGAFNDDDEVNVNSGTEVLGVYTGRRINPFYGAAVENPSYTLQLKSGESGTYDGFVVDISSYLVLTNSPNVSSNPGSIYWSTSAAAVYLDRGLGNSNGLSEVNAFYHLNAMHHYFDPINLDPSAIPVMPADLSQHIAVMVHAHGDADNIGTYGGMLNAFYDIENNNIMIGDGQIDYNGIYRSFALDGTIVRHEYTHFVVNRIYTIINFGEFGAISEALADYFAMASFWNEGQTLSALGNFVDSGEGGARDISGASPTGERIMPADWKGEVHEDSLILSEALYKLRKNATYDLGSFSSGLYAGSHRTDVLAYAALFYFPDNFANYRDAMIDACAQFNAKWPGSCDSTMSAKIASAFAYHGIGASGDAGDPYESAGTSSLCRNNNGPECASDIGTLSSLSATIYPLGDTDYYSLPLAPGNLTATLSLPSGGYADTYKAYAMFLFDATRSYISEAVPAFYNACENSDDCVTQSPTVTLNYTVPAAGRYYLAVSPAPNQYYDVSGTNSSLPYTLTLSRTVAGSAQAEITAAAYDGDEITFAVPSAFFPMYSAPSSTGTEFTVEYAQLRDHNREPLDLTRTNLPGSYMRLLESGTDSQGVTGRVGLQAGFGARYPGVGTVYLEIFGRNHIGNVMSLGISSALNLSSNRSAITAYNNIIASPGAKAILKYEVQSAGSLTIKVYTQSGSLVRTVFSGPVSPGKGTVEWDGTNSGGGKAASGIYFVKAKGPGLDSVVKIAIVR